MSEILAVAVRTVAALAAWGCGGAGERALPGDGSHSASGDVHTADVAPGAGEPTFAPTFSAIYREIFVPSNCTLGLCHGEGAKGGGLDLHPRSDARAALVGTTSASQDCAGRPLVDPADPGGSLLLQKLRPDPPCGTPMPPDAPLDAREVEQIRAWIALGAPDD